MDLLANLSRCISRDRLNEREGVAPKMVFVYPLIPDAFRQLQEG
jgi:hypothetical protein